MSDTTHPILLVHGLFGHQRTPRILAAFGTNAVFVPDMLGYGVHRGTLLTGVPLIEQARHVVRYMDENGLGKVHLVGHSVGGAISALIAIHWPDRLASYITVEGNFTLKDAFWSKSISQKSEQEVEDILATYQADPVAWFKNAGVPSSPWSDALAVEWLENQPAATIKAQATAVVQATESAEYLQRLEQVFRSDLPVNLIAGARASAGWDTPVWANQYCAMRINMPGVGHLMMAEAPEAYAKAVLTCVRAVEG